MTANNFGRGLMCCSVTKFQIFILIFTHKIVVIHLSVAAHQSCTLHIIKHHYPLVFPS